MEHSPLCSRDQGREITFTARDGGQKLRFTLPRSLLDQLCGNDAAEDKRKTWVKDHMSDILNIRTSGRAEAPLHLVHIEEIA